MGFYSIPGRPKKTVSRIIYKTHTFFEARFNDKSGKTDQTFVRGRIASYIVDLINYVTATALSLSMQLGR